MHITHQQQLTFHYAEQRALLREYFPHADPEAVHAWIEALRRFDVFPTQSAADRLALAYELIASSVPIIEIEPSGAEPF